MVYSPIETLPAFDPLASKYGELCTSLKELLVSKATFEQDVQLADSSVRCSEYGAGVYFVSSGQLSFVMENTTLLYYEEGEIFSIDGLLGDASAAEIRSDYATQYEFIPFDTFQAVLEESREGRDVWQDILVASAGMFSVLSRSTLHEQTEFTPKMLNYEVGDIILQEGESGSEVLTMVSGTADVYVSGTLVGQIGEDEIFGALAAFGGMKRTATVKAAAPCTVLSLPKEHFTDLIRTRPLTISKLVEDLAGKMNHLNEKVIELSKKKGTEK